MNSYLPAELFVIIVWSVTALFALEITALIIAWLKTASWSKVKARIKAVKRIGRTRQDRTLSGKEISITTYYRMHCIYEYQIDNRKIVGTKVNLADFGCFKQNFEQEQFDTLADAKEAGSEIDIFVQLWGSHQAVIFRWVSLIHIVSRSLGLAIGSVLIIVGSLGWLDTDLAGSPPMLSLGLSGVGILLGTGTGLIMQRILSRDIERAAH